MEILFGKIAPPLLEYSCFSTGVGGGEDKNWNSPLLGCSRKYPYPPWGKLTIHPPPSPDILYTNVRHTFDNFLPPPLPSRQQKFLLPVGTDVYAINNKMMQTMCLI